MKLCEFKNEEALDVLADIFEPSINILKDPIVLKAFSGELANTKIYEVISQLIKKYPTDILKIVARLDNIPYEKANYNIVKLAKSMLELTKDKELMAFFKSQGQMMAEDNSGSATENTEGTDET